MFGPLFYIASAGIWLLGVMIAMCFAVAAKRDDEELSRLHAEWVRKNLT